MVDLLVLHPLFLVPFALFFLLLLLHPLGMLTLLPQRHPGAHQHHWVVLSKDFLGLLPIVCSCIQLPSSCCISSLCTGTGAGSDPGQ